MRLSITDFPGIGNFTENIVREIYSRLPQITHRESRFVIIMPCSWMLVLLACYYK